MAVWMVPVMPEDSAELSRVMLEYNVYLASLVHGDPTAMVLKGSPFTTPGRQAHWLVRDDIRYGHVLLEVGRLPRPGGAPGTAVGLCILRLAVQTEYRNRGWGTAALPLIEEHALKNDLPLTWTCWLINPALSFWERWTRRLRRRGWTVTVHFDPSPVPARTYVARPLKSSDRTSRGS